jgi:ribosome biogenesis protein MAK21
VLKVLISVLLQGLSHDTVANVREKMVGHIFDLLYQRPEQEQELLSQLVNKIGDPIKKIASKVILFILKLRE